MVEDTVNDDPHAPGMTGLHKVLKDQVRGLQILPAGGTDPVALRMAVVRVPVRQQCPIVPGHGTHMRIHMPVVLGIILMVGGRHKERVEIDHPHPETVQIVQLLLYALQITAVEAVHIEGLRRCAPVLDPLRISSEIDVLVIQHIVVGISVPEAVDQDLVHDGALDPIRHVVAGNQLEGQRRVVTVGYPQAIVAHPSAVRSFGPKDIGKGLISHFHCGFEVIKVAVAGHRFHFLCFLQCRKFNIDPGCILPQGAEAQRHQVPRIRFLRTPVEGISRAIQCIPVHFLTILISILSSVGFISSL